MPNTTPSDAHRLVDRARDESRAADDRQHFVDRLLVSLYSRQPAARRAVLLAKVQEWENIYGPDHPDGVKR